MVPPTLLFRWLTLFALLAPVYRATAQEPVAVGIGSHSLDETSRRLLHSLGATKVRTTLYWNEWETSPDYRQSISDQIEQASAEDLDLVVVVHGQPNRFSFSNRYEAFEAYAEFVGSLARRFPRVEAWQLWNEMDVPTFTDLFGARNGLDPTVRGRLYGEMLERAYAAIKRASPAALVITGGLASALDNGFVEGLLRTGARMDALAIHTYGFPVLTSVERRGMEARTVLDRNGRRETPVWVTEFGMKEAVVAPGFDRSSQAIDRYHLEAWRDPVLWNARMKVFDRMYGHVLREGGDGSYDLIRRDGSLRPAALWLRSYLR